jgi:WXG100 family type VII secretion target
LSASQWLTRGVVTEASTIRFLNFPERSGKMANTQQLNYDEMQGIIKQLETEQEDVKALFNQTKSMVESLHGSQWMGEAADRFFNEMESQVLPKTTKMLYALTVAGQVAKQIVNIIHQADEETKSFFSNLGS